MKLNRSLKLYLTEKHFVFSKTVLRRIKRHLETTINKLFKIKNQINLEVLEKYSEITTLNNQELVVDDKIGDINSVVEQLKDISEVDI